MAKKKKKVLPLVWAVSELEMFINVWIKVLVDLIFLKFFLCPSDLLFVEFAGENAEKLLQFKRWFWSIVEKMSMTERQDLVRHYLLEFFYIF